MGRRSPCEDHLVTIQALLAQGKTRKQIAETIGLSCCMVQAFLQRRKIAGLPREKRKLKVDEGRLRTRLAEGHTQTHIATMLGVSKSAIERRAAGWGLQTARTGPRSGTGHPEWEGGRLLGNDEYVMVYAPLHPCAVLGNGRVAEHRLVMDVVLGRYLTAEEEVHHRDGIGWHNWPDNLVLYPDHATHFREAVGDHRRHKAHRRMTAQAGIPSSSPLWSARDVLQNSRSAGRWRIVADTLAQCPLEIQARLVRHIAIHHPTIAQQSLPRRALLGIGASSPPFPVEYLEENIDSPR